MTDDHRCDSCSMAGCTSRQTEEKVQEEASAGIYLFAAMVFIVGCSLLVKWLF